MTIPRFSDVALDGAATADEAAKFEALNDPVY